MKSVSFFALVFLLAIHNLCAQNVPLWGSLQKGKYHVGFKTISAYDLSRPAISEFDVMGHLLYNSINEPGRQVRINVWYPSLDNGKKKMDYEEYIHETSKGINFSTLSEEDKKKSLNKYMEEVRRFDNPEFNADELSKFSKLSTAASMEAKEAPGRFPIVIYPAYLGPASQSIFAEYLASNGYIVVHTVQKGADSSIPEISVTGIEAQVGDLAFALSEVKKIPQADANSVALMGVGFSATSCLALLTRNKQIDAFISLDGGITVVNEKRMLQQTPFYDPVAIDKPMLMIYSSHPDVQPATLDDYKYSDRYFFHVPSMREFDCTDFGMLQRFSPNLIGKPLGDTGLGSEWIYKYMLNFLNFTLKNDSPSKSFILNEPKANNVPDELIIPSFKKALRTPPSLQELKQLVAEKGAAGLTAIYNELKTQDPQPFSQKCMGDFFNWLGFLRDKDFLIRTELIRIWLESYPQSSRGNFLLARLLGAKGEKEKTLASYREALRLLDSDTDPFLDNNTRTRIRTTANSEINKR